MCHGGTAMTTGRIVLVLLVMAILVVSGWFWLTAH